MTTNYYLPESFLSSPFLERIHKYTTLNKLSPKVYEALAGWIASNYHEEDYNFAAYPNLGLTLGYLGPVMGQYAAKAHLYNPIADSIVSEQVFISTLQTKLFHLPCWGMSLIFKGDNADIDYAAIHPELQQIMANKGYINWSPWSIVQLDAKDPVSCWKQADKYLQNIDILFAKVTAWAAQEVLYYLNTKLTDARISIIGRNATANHCIHFVTSMITSQTKICKSDRSPEADCCDILIVIDRASTLTTEQIIYANPKAIILFSHHAITSETEDYCRKNHIIVLPSIVIKGIEDLALHFFPCDPGNQLLEQRWRSAFKVLLLESRKYNNDVMTAIFARIITAFRSYLQI